ncbi:MAG TPA: TonB family protein [Terracidiphilus sp.]|nr:TonB family protein [Terracidiphilus sp.]
MSIALIGPDAGRRRVVARALAKQEDRTVREFAGYPASIEDLERVLAGPCDVVMIDLDSDEAFALEVVQTIAAMSETTVIVFSTRTDPDLVVKSMRAGARDLLPIPAQEVEEAKRNSISGGQEAGPIAETQSPAAVAAPMAAVPRRVPLAGMEEFAARPQAASAAEAAGQKEAIKPKQEAIQPNPTAPDFSEWDKANLRPLLSAAPAPVEFPAKGAGKSQGKSQSKDEAKKPARDEAKKPARDEAKKPANELAQPAKPELVDANTRMHRAMDVPAKTKQTPAELFNAAAAMPRPVRSAAVEAEVAAPLFDSTAWRAEEESKRGPESSSDSSRKSKKWMVLVAGPVVVAGLLYVVLMRPAQQIAPAATQVQTAAEPDATAADAQPASPMAMRTRSSANGDAASTGAAGPGTASTGTAGPGAGAAQTPASSEMMDAQLTAPSRIAKDIHSTPGPASTPPVGPSLGAFAGSGLPAVVPVSGSHVKVAPGVLAISAGVAEGMLIHKVNPIYPKFARDNHMSGMVVLKAKITKAGTLEDVEIVSGPRILGPAAMDAVKHWRYRPYTLDNQPVEVETMIRVAFLPVN